MITEQGDSSIVVAAGTSTEFIDNRHSKFFHSGANTDSVVLQSVTIPLDNALVSSHYF